jgi:hypothetical protein
MLPRETTPEPAVGESKSVRSRHRLNSGTGPLYCASAAGAPAEPGPRVEHRTFTLGNDIAANGISCKLQKVQAMSPLVEIGRCSRTKARQVSRKTWLPCHGRAGTVVARPEVWALQGWGGGGSAAVFRPGAEDEQDQAAWSKRAGRDCCLG